MKTIHLKCGHRIQVKTWPSRAGMAKMRHHYKKFHPMRMKKMTKKSLATKRKRGLINPKRKRYKYVLVGSQYIPIGQYGASHAYPSIVKAKRVRKPKRKIGLIENKCKPNPKSTLIYDKLLGIEAHKSHGKFSGQNFKHDFKDKTDAMVLGNPDGSLTIRSKKGKRLWKKFNY